MSEAYPQPVRDPRRPFIASPFTRLARTHALSVGGDALFTVGLAGTIFFAVSPQEAPAKIGLYLLLTFAPFAVAAPFIGPVLDRVKGGRRWMIVAAIGLRAVLCVLIVRDLNSPAFYVEAFLMLVFQKAYLISRASVVPTTVRSDRELVEANSKLAMLSGLAAIVAGGPGLVLLKVGGDHYGPQLAVGLGAVVYAVGAVFATRLPRVQVAAEKPSQVERQELRSAGIRLAASAMALMRCAVGFLVLLLALSYKDHQLHLWAVSAAVVAAQAGVLAGAWLAPRLRNSFSEARIVVGSLAATLLGGAVAALLGNLAGAFLLSFLLGVTSGTAKQAFDALVQRDAPDANRGRSFAKFETKFQLAWVFGAAIPLIFRFPLVVGYTIVGVGMAAGLVSYWLGQRRVARGTYEWESTSRKLFRRGLRKVDASLAPRRPPGDDPTGVEAAPGEAGGAAAVGMPPPPGQVAPPAATPVGVGSAVPAPRAVGGRPPAAGPTPSPAPSPPAWTPPPGFVSEPLVSTRPEPRPAPPVVFDGEADLAADYVAEMAADFVPAPVSARPAGADPQDTAPDGGGPVRDEPDAVEPDPVQPDPTTVQPSLPLDFVDPATDPDATTFAEPLWRDST
jgi:MFS family permease